MALTWFICRGRPATGAPIHLWIHASMWTFVLLKFYDSSPLILQHEDSQSAVWPSALLNTWWTCKFNNIREIS